MGYCNSGENQKLLTFNLFTLFQSSNVLLFHGLTIPRVLALCLALAFILGASRSWGSETVIVNKAFNGREIKVRAGGMIHVELEELGAAGYTWAVQDLDREHFEILNVQTGDPPSPGDVSGAPVIRTWLIKAKKEGRSELRLFYFRPWEGEKNAVETFVLKVRIL